jgi:hypothetical protein
MSELKNGKEVCSKCQKPYIAKLDGEFCKCEVVIKHTDPLEIQTALALKYRQRAREAEEKLIVCEVALKFYRDRDKQLEDILMATKGGGE